MNISPTTADFLDTRLTAGTRGKEVDGEAVMKDKSLSHEESVMERRVAEIDPITRTAYTFDPFFQNSGSFRPVSNLILPFSHAAAEERTGKGITCGSLGDTSRQSKQRVRWERRGGIFSDDDA